MSLAQPLVGDGCRQVRLAATIATGQQHPIFWALSIIASESGCLLQTCYLVGVEFLLAQAESVECLVAVQRKARQLGAGLVGAAQPEIGSQDGANLYQVGISQP